MNRVRDLGRALLLFLVRLAFSAAPKPPPAIDASKIRKLLVIRTDTRVGNVLLTTPLVRALRKGLPNARVDFLVAAGKERLVEGLADRVIGFQKQNFFKKPGRFFAFIRGLKREQYDVVIEAGHWHAFSFTAGWLARATRAEVRIGHRRGLSERFLTHEVEKDAANVRDVASKLELLRPLNLASDGERLETTVDSPREIAEACERIVAELGGGKRIAALNPGARKPDHRWAPEAFGALAQRLSQELGLVPVVLWGPGEEAIADAVLRASNGAAKLAPPTDLAKLAGLFRRSAVVITNDTGPMHLAVAAGAPVLAVLLADDGARWSHDARFSGVPVKSGDAEAVERVLQAAKKLLADEPAREKSAGASP